MMKKSQIIFAAFLILLLCGCGKNNIETNSAGEVSRLHVENNRIADENGNTVQLTGMSSHGLLWYAEYTNANAMKTLKSYGANVFRIAVYSDDESGGYVQKKEESLRLTYMAIENAISVDMYAIVDWHVLNDENPLKNQSAALEFFEAISSHYGDCSNILYEICNEPNGTATWSDICEYAESVIPVIRKNAPDSIIIVGTPGYSHSLDKVFKSPLMYENIMYSFHYYAGEHSEEYTEVLDRCDKYGIPVFVSEWGIGFNSKGEAAISEGKRFAQVLNRRKISWVAWSLSNKDEVYSAILYDCPKIGGWEKNDLTDVGRVYFESF